MKKESAPCFLPERPSDSRLLHNVTRFRIDAQLEILVVIRIFGFRQLPELLNRTFQSAGDASSTSTRRACRSCFRPIAVFFASGADLINHEATPRQRRMIKLLATRGLYSHAWPADYETAAQKTNQFPVDC